MLDGETIKKAYNWYYYMYGFQEDSLGEDINEIDIIYLNKLKINRDIQIKKDLEYIKYKNIPDIKSFSLWKYDDDYILNSLPFCHNLNKNPPYTIQECINMSYIRGVFYLSYFTDVEIIKKLGPPIRLYSINNKSNKIHYNNNSRLYLLRSYFSNLGDEYLKDVRIPEKGNYDINESFRIKYVETAQQYWDINLDYETKNIVHISWDDFYNSLGFCVLIANFYSSYRKLKIVNIINYISDVYRGSTIKIPYLKLGEENSINWINKLTFPLFMTPEEMGYTSEGNFLFFSDDVVYSATQLNDNLQDIYNIFFEKETTLKTFGRMEIGIFIPYMSILGKNNLLSSSILQKYKIFYADILFDAYTNIYFDHKIADMISVNEDLIRGKIKPEFIYDSDNSYIPYINKCIYDKDPQNHCIFPPYKTYKNNNIKSKNINLN